MRKCNWVGLSVWFSASCAASAFGLAGLASCNTFDDDLEALIPQDGAAGAAGASGSTTLADSCSDSLPLMASTKEPVLYDTSKLTNRRTQAGSCGIGSDVLAGADTFFELRANAGERWHFHVDGLPDQDLAIYVSPSDVCDDRLCGSAADVCGPWRSEHFTFIPESSGTFIVGLDGIDASAGATLSLLAINPTCGDGKKEHSEVCDDNDVSSGDGCDSHCRVELSKASDQELEPNDDTYGANVLMLQDGAMTVRGKLGGTVCQPDYFLVDLPTEQILDIVVLDIAGNACADAPEMNLDVIETDGDRLRENIKRASGTGSDGGCPTISKTLPKGAYFLRLAAVGAETELETGYQLRVTLSDP
jgi:cysteine-rich repeat protein